MPDSFPGAPESDHGSFPRGIEPREDAPTQPDGLLLFRRYRVLKELGRGGMGVVMLAQDTALDVPVAIKMVPDQLTKDTDAISDLRKEVLRGMALNHDGVVRTINFEKDESGAAIVMEYVDGYTLTELKAQQPGGCFDPEQILPWVEVLCEVLDYAHRQKHFIHRDLKPRNVMLTRSGQIKVADFGIAALISDSMSQHSKDGIVSGTLSYMSPQQAQGKRPSPLDDIHALGATIYELLTSKPPFFRGNPMALYGQVIHEVPPSMAERREDLGVVGKREIPEPWEKAIAACLAKEPEQRPQTAGEVVARLKRSTVKPRPVLPPPPTPEPAPRSGGLHPPSSTPAPQAPIPPRPPEVSGLRPEPAPRRMQSAAPWGSILVALVLLGVTAGGMYVWQQQAPRPRPEPLPVEEPITPRATPVTTPVPTPRAAPKPFSTPRATPTPTSVSVDSLAAATKDAPFQNTLGMKFVPVPGTKVLFSIWETRVKDYAVFAKETGHEVERPTFTQTPEDPAVNISWDDAQAFCHWLSKKEGREYRLPTDEEWSVAVGLANEGAGTPQEKEGSGREVFPWGSQWPPPAGAGNFADATAKKADPGFGYIDSYDDGYANTSPVGKFLPNRYGIYDLSGNAYEWCEDWYDREKKYRILRGGSWVDGDPGYLRSSLRFNRAQTLRRVSYGFRCVVR